MAGKLNIEKLLLEEYGAKDDIHPCHECALLWASDQGHYDLVKLLIEDGANVNTFNAYDERETALVNASKKGHYDIVKFLIENGANLNRNGEMALIVACDFGHVNVERLLLECGGASVHMNLDQIIVECSYRGFKDGEFKHSDVVEVLLEYGADLDELDRYWHWPDWKVHKLIILHFEPLLRKGWNYKGNNKIALDYIKWYQLKCVRDAELNSKLPDELLKSIAVYI